MSPVELNLKAVVAATVAGLVALYILYSVFPKNSLSNMSVLKQLLTWKTETFKEIPLEINEKAKGVKIRPRQETINVDGEVHNLISFVQHCLLQYSTGCLPKHAHPA